MNATDTLSFAPLNRPVKSAVVSAAPAPAMTSLRNMANTISPGSASRAVQPCGAGLQPAAGLPTVRRIPKRQPHRATWCRLAACGGLPTRLPIRPPHPEAPAAPCSHVGQAGSLRRVANPPPDPSAASPKRQPHRAAMWGRLAACGGFANRPPHPEAPAAPCYVVQAGSLRRVCNPPPDPSAAPRGASRTVLRSAGWQPAAGCQPASRSVRRIPKRQPHRAAMWGRLAACGGIATPPPAPPASTHNNSHCPRMQRP